jgi:hypothetical protein
MYLKQEASGNLATNTAPSAETETPPITNTVAEPPTIVTEPTNAAPVVDTNVAAAAPPVETNAPAPAAIETNLPANPPAPVIVDTNLPPPPPRKVSHEGTVRHVVSPVAPTDYELYDPVTGKNVDYLFTTSETLDLSQYNGLRVVVTGTEGLDARWKDTPVITIERIQVIQ